MSQPPVLEVSWLGTVPYLQAWALQRQLAELRAAERLPDQLLLLEHPPVITLGRRGTRADVLADEQVLDALEIQVVSVNRGGLATYHGPGQLIGYPIVDLRKLAGDAPGYVTGLEETIMRALREHGLVTLRDAAHRGVWTPQGKLAAIGVGVSRGVTMHGFAVNLHPDLRHFDLIDPCGLADRGVTSLERLTGQRVESEAFRHAVSFHFGQVFERDVRPGRFENRHAQFEIASAPGDKPGLRIASLA
ncbi:MAG: lipoyl(octanoyl) transferase LipB [Chloroflexi bacterium]|nr:lipoyl(octanoyl) transferase LipB [Chloroflexota bacterium]